MSLMMSDYLTGGADVSEPDPLTELYGDPVRAKEVFIHLRNKVL